MPVKSFTFNEVDKGIVTQFPSNKVAFSTGNNVRIEPGFVSKTLGKALVTTNAGSVPIRAMFTFVGTDGAIRTIMCCDTIVYAYNSTLNSASDITPTPAPTGGASDVWQFELVSGLPILSNGKDAIRKWTSYAGVLTALSGAPTWAKRLSSCMNRLVVSNLLEGGYTYPGRVRWTGPGNPENWTLDTTNKAGRHDIVSYQGGVEASANIKAQITRGHEVFFFAERGLWKADFAAATRNFICVNPITEILSSRALCKKEETIYFIGKNDLFLSGGGDPTAIGLPVRDELFDNLNASAIASAFVVAPYKTAEVWFCVATGTNTAPNKAFIYNTETKSFSIQDVDFSCHAEALYTGVPYDVVGNAAGQILTFDSGFNTAAGLAIDGRIETGDLDFGLPNNMKTIAEVIPELAVQDTVSELMIQVGVRNRLSDDLRWSDPVPFTIGVSDKCDLNGFRKSGKFVRVRFYSDLVTSPWKLSGYTINYEVGGTR
ncbi:MAG: hypothetical protein E4G97_00790 [Deltaproteobacteria bacterium]|nr:MAG: hypothetical protein E4G97_00790 [Deltaproteobacteria bacterium]